MRELTYSVATSLDGLIAAPDGDFSAFPVEGDHMAVLFDEFVDTMPGHVLRALGREAHGERFDTVVMGWNTYTPALDVGIDSPYPHLRQIVASRTRRELPVGVEHSPDPVATVRELKAEEGAGIWLAGGGALAASLVDEIDRLILKINPLVLGSGIRIFGEAPYAARDFARVSARTFDSGVIIAEYARA